MLNRRNFLRSAAGLFVASAALAVPDRRVFALDQTMIPGTMPRMDGRPPGGSVIDFSNHDGPPLSIHADKIHPGINPESFWPLDPLTPEIWKYDVVRVQGKYWGVAIDPAQDWTGVIFLTEQDGMAGLHAFPNGDIETYRSLYEDSR